LELTNIKPDLIHVIKNLWEIDQPWFNYECKVARQNYRKLKRKLKIKRTEALKQDVAEAEKRYKKTLDKHSKIYRADLRKKIKKN
jgi:hypothetical protein